MLAFERALVLAKRAGGPRGGQGRSASAAATDAAQDTIAAARAGLGWRSPALGGPAFEGPPTIAPAHDGGNENSAGSSLESDLRTAQQHWRTYGHSYARGQRSEATARVGHFHDLGVSQQAAWYEKTCGEPLVHEATGTRVFLHSVNRFHAASIETARAVLAFARPAVLAVQLPNGQAWGPVEAVRSRIALAPTPQDVVRIVDGYHRICRGVHEASEENPTPEALARSHGEGRALARSQGLLDIDNDIDDAVAASHSRAARDGSIEELERQRAEIHAQRDAGELDCLLQHDLWQAMYCSGLLPLEHYDRPALQAYEAGKGVEFVGVSMRGMAAFIQKLHPQSDKQAELLDAREREAFTGILRAFGADMLPHGLPLDIVDVMSPCVMFPEQIDVVLALMSEHAPVTTDLAKFKAMYTVKALAAIAENHSALQSGVTRHVVCLVERLQEPLMRVQWQAAQGIDIESGSDAARGASVPVAASMEMNVVQRRGPDARASRRRRRG